jgi:hypothetical protein
MISTVKKSKESVALLIIEGGNGWGDFYFGRRKHLVVIVVDVASPAIVPSL